MLAPTVGDGRGHDPPQEIRDGRAQAGCKRRSAPTLTRPSGPKTANSAWLRARRALGVTSGRGQYRTGKRIAGSPTLIGPPVPPPRPHDPPPRPLPPTPRRRRQARLLLRRSRLRRRRDRPAPSSLGARARPRPRRGDRQDGRARAVRHPHRRAVRRSGRRHDRPGADGARDRLPQPVGRDHARRGDLPRRQAAAALRHRRAEA